MSESKKTEPEDREGAFGSDARDVENHALGDANLGDAHLSDAHLNDAHLNDAHLNDAHPGADDDETPSGKRNAVRQATASMRPPSTVDARRALRDLDLKRALQRPLVLVPAAALLVLLVVLFLTRGQMEQLAFLRSQSTAAENGLVDQRPEQTADTLASLAVSVEEQHLAAQAQRLAAHEVDDAFQLALRQAAMDLRAPTGQAAVLAHRVEELKALVQADSAKVDALKGAPAVAPAADGSATPAALSLSTAAAAANDPSAQGAPPGDGIDVARAQLTLDRDDLNDASDDLARELGDRRGEIQQELVARQASGTHTTVVGSTAAASTAGGGALIGGTAMSGASKVSALTAATENETLAGRIRAWFAGNERMRLLEQARTEAIDDAHALAGEHDSIERKSAAIAQGNATLANAALVGKARVAVLEGMSARRTMMSTIDERIDVNNQLADLYARWKVQVEQQHQLINHLILESFATILGVVLGTIVLSLLGRSLAARLIKDPRQARTLVTVVTLAIQVVSILLILLILFGLPQQTPTILGLATAGLTVVFQDFILAFFGWFVLMSRGGIRANDWVEINGIGGEVVEIGLFRTTLLETGNWTAKGHPTGRRVRLINSFAIRGQYFNFTTNGQWMWEELKMNLPADPKVYELIRAIQTAVESETANDTRLAAMEWRRTDQESEMSQFDAKPTVDLRPAAAGVDVIIRFVTRASERFDAGNRIYAAVVKLMQESAVLLPQETTAEPHNGTSGT